MKSIDTSVKFVLISIGILLIFSVVDRIIVSGDIKNSQSKISQYLEWERQINDAMYNLYRTNEKIKSNKIAGADAVMMRENARLDLEKAYIGAGGIINESVEQNAVLLNQLDKSVDNLLAETSPPASVWQTYMARNSIIIELEIRKQQEVIAQAQQWLPVRLLSKLKNIL